MPLTTRLLGNFTSTSLQYALSSRVGQSAWLRTSQLAPALLDPSRFLRWCNTTTTHACSARTVQSHHCQLAHFALTL